MDKKIKKISNDIIESDSYKSGLIRWKFGAEMRKPTLAEIERMINVIIEDMENDSSITAGGLIIQKTNNHLDVYLYIGDAGQ